MGFKTELQSNNIDLQTILNKVNALPEAGGGGGASVETCTIILNSTSYGMFVCSVNTDYGIDSWFNNFFDNLNYGDPPQTVYDVVVGTSITIFAYGEMPGYQIEGGYELLTEFLDTGALLVVRAYPENGNDVIINIGG